MLLLFVIFSSIQLHIANAATCNTVAALGNTWNQGQDGTLNFVVPTATSAWTIVVTFDKPVTTLSPWQGILVGCAGGTVCTFKNQNYNGQQNQGATLVLTYQIQFASTSVAPKITALTFNGATICSNGAVASTTTATPTASSTQNSGGAPTCGPTFYDYPSQWTGGANGNFYLKFPVAVTTWTVTVQFSSNVNGLSVWNGANINCAGSTCTFTDAGYNSNQAMGASLTLGFQVVFNGSPAPNVIAIFIQNGGSICSGAGTGGTTLAPVTTTTTITTTTTTATTITTTTTQTSTTSTTTITVSTTAGPTTATLSTTSGSSTTTSQGTSACGPIFYDYPYQWSGGANGNFYLKFPVAVAAWTVTVQFSSNVNTLSVWDGANINCAGSTCSFTNAGYNANQALGASLTLGFQVTFNGAPAPNVIGIAIQNGGTICSGAGTGGTTQAPITTTTTTVSSTSGPSTTTVSTTSGPSTTTTQGASTTTPASTGRCADYSSLINLSMLFYEAQRSGKLPANQRVTWRKDSALNDKGANGEDLTGGYYDAGDFVKFGFPMAYTITVLAWGGVAYPEGYTNAGQTSYLLDAVKWGTDYFIKAHVSPNMFYGQVGDGNIDHSYWGRPEDMTMARPAFAITTSNPGSELAGETAAAMAAASILFKTANPAYSATLLTHAQQLFTFADTYRGNYANSISNAAGFYNSYNGYNDELVWAALWLYKATGTQSYLTYATTGYSSYGFSGNTDVLSWDSKIAGIKILLAQITGQASYLQDVQNLCNFFTTQAPRSPLGEVFLSQWGSLRYASNAAYICLLASDLNIPATQKTAYQAFAVDQMEYILQKTGRSFVIGFGTNSPTRPHHRSSSCPDAPASCDWNTYNSAGPNYHVLSGALVGGPAAANDQYTDVRSDYVSNEVATDYNAGFQSLLAGLKKKACP